MDVRRLLQEPDRKWHARPGCADADLKRLSSASPVCLPDLLFDFLLFSNGGEGPLALPPLVFILDDVDFIIGNVMDLRTRELYPGLVLFGSNGGLERIAFDVRGTEPPWPIVMMDPVAGNDSAIVIARDI
jgi:hypothetical protein